MDSASGGERDGDGETTSSSLGPESLHDHSDLLIPNPSFLSSPASVSSTASSMMMSITSPDSVNSDNDLYNRQMMDCQMTSPRSVDDGQMDHQMGPPSQPDSSPPNVIVDDSPLQPCMDRNKQSLKVKLLMRRPMNQLVDQGILPPPKTPAAFAGQRVRLERARMGDLLKAKIQQRPARQELIRQHILEDTDSRVAPSLAEKQRMLKRARLADSLNDHLIHRPGPLELVQKNILHAPDADIEKAIKEGIVNFKATSEGHVPGPSLPCKYTVNEDDSSSDISSPAGTPDASSSGHNTEANTPISKQLSDPAICLPSPAPPPTVSCVPTSEPCEVTLQPAKTNKSETAAPQVTPQLILAAPKTLAGSAQQLAQAAAIFQVTTPATTAVIPPPPPLPTFSAVTTIPPPPPLPQTIVLSDGAVRELLPQLQSAGFQLAAAHVQKPSISQSSSSSSFGKSRSSKKSNKGKSQPKARTIKFHEYKGPTAGQPKGSSSSNSSPCTSLTSQSSAESSYELLLKQQQLFLQWQLEWQHKYPQILLPAAPKTGGSGASSLLNSSATLSSFPVTAIPASLCTHLLNSNNQQTSSQQPASSPATITVASTLSTDANQRPITLGPKMTEIAPKPPEMSSETKFGLNDSASSPASSTSSAVEKSPSLKLLNLSNISDWKVNDLKAALKKRSLPVSGSKSQLVERLKAAAAKDGNNGSENKPISIKMEVTSADENSSEAMMETNSGVNEETNPGNKCKNQPVQTHPTSIGGPPATPQQQSENNNISILDLANGKLNGVPISLQNILSLLGVAATDRNILMTNNNNPTADNNLKNSNAIGGVVQSASTTTAKVFSQLPISTVVATAAKAVAAAAAAASSAETSASSTAAPNSKLVDENKILEQQKQILELQKALRISQQQLQQLSQQKDPKQGGPQKHRLVLQQHIQQKLQQQAIANQLQNLIQLQTQQAEHKKQLLQQQQQQAQTQPQLVLISSNNNQPVANVENNVLPLTIVSQPPQQHQSQQGNANNHWPSQPQHQQNEVANKTTNTSTANLTSVFDELVRSIGTKDVPKQETEAEARKRCVKSQMVDDVLEILIRNGELPPSAAQDPHGKTSSHPTSSSTTPSTSTGTTNATAQAPPPPPPLPPPTFSVMLPTTIPFPRHHSTNNAEFLSFRGLTERTGEHLSKDAQEILRICEDLSNFGKSREAEAAQAAANARLENGNMDCGFFTETSGPNTTSDNKDFDLSATHHHNSVSSGTADSMDIGFGDTHSVSLHSTGNKPQSVVNHQYHNSPFDSGTFSFGHPNVHTQHLNSTFKSSHDHHHNFMGDDELLPVSLDMQMDTDYSDWLDTLLPESSTNNCPTTANSSTTNLFHHQPDTIVAENKMNSAKGQDNLFNHNNNLSNSNSQNTSSNGPNIFGSLLDDHDQQQHQQQLHHSHQRDPLLSSRSFVTRENNSSPFIGDLTQQGGFTFSSHHNQQQHPLLIFHNPSSSTATMMDTDFDELTATHPATINTKKSENILSASSHNNVITEMPSTTSNIITAPITTTSSINDNFLWDFAM